MKIKTGRAKIIIIVLLSFILLVLVILFVRSGKEESPKIPSSSFQVENKPGEEIPKETKRVTLFFLSEEDNLFHQEEREISRNPSLIQEAQEVMDELIKGSRLGYVSPLPPETKLRQIFLTKEGVLYVDFSKELAGKHLSGSSAEIATVYSVVNSLAYNFRPVKKVFILIEGEERDTLGGHIDLSKPFLPDYSLVAD